MFSCPYDHLVQSILQLSCFIMLIFCTHTPVLTVPCSTVKQVMESCTGNEATSVKGGFYHQLELLLLLITVSKISISSADNTAIYVVHVGTSGVAKPGPTQAWVRASASREQLNIVLAICNDAVSYTLLTSLFARFAFNTGENLYCAHACQSHGSELLPIQDWWFFKNIVSRTIWVATSKMEKFTRRARPQPTPHDQKKQQQTCAVPRRHLWPGYATGWY